MMVSRHGRAVTLVTGVGSGIGRATAVRVATRGDHVVLAGRTEPGLRETAETIHAVGGQADVHLVDVRDRAALERMGADVGRRLGGVTYLFSNAGATSRNRVSDLTLEQWNMDIQSHVTGAFHCCQVVLPGMVERKDGAIVVMASDYSILGMRNGAAYTAAMAAVYSLTKALALEFAPHGIRVNAVGPGPIDTPHLRKGQAGAEWEAKARG